MSLRRGALVGIAAVVVLVAFIFVGRWERNRHVARERTKMEAVLHEASPNGGLVSPQLVGYRLSVWYDCLVYRSTRYRGATAGLEVCIDRWGRLVQTIDRASGSPHFGSLLEQPSQAIKVPVMEVVHALVAAGAFKDPRMAGVPRIRTDVPVGFNDIGAFRKRTG